MPSPTPCVPCCTTPQSVNIPGIQGDPGTNGADGINAFTLLTAGFTVGGAGNAHLLSVANSQWMAVGQVLVVAGPVHVVVTSISNTVSVNVTELNYAGDLPGASAIAAGAKVSSAGPASPVITSGSSTLVAGTKTISANVTANSVILATWNDPDAATVGVLSIPTGTRTPGTPGSFVVNSVKADGTTPLATDTGGFDWVVIG